MPRITALMLSIAIAICVPQDVRGEAGPDRLLRASMALGGGEFADNEGVRFSGNYFWLLRQLGPGQLLAGLSVHYMFANGVEDRAGCSVAHRDRMGQAGASGRYTLNTRGRLRPWTGVGVTLDYKRHSRTERDAPCMTDVKESKTSYGPGVELGVGVDIAVRRSLYFTVEGWGHAGEPNLAVFALGLALSFP